MTLTFIQDSKSMRRNYGANYLGSSQSVFDDILSVTGTYWFLKKYMLFFFFMCRYLKIYLPLVHLSLILDLHIHVCSGAADWL